MSTVIEDFGLFEDETEGHLYSLITFKMYIELFYRHGILDILFGDNANEQLNIMLTSKLIAKIESYGMPIGQAIHTFVQACSLKNGMLGCIKMEHKQANGWVQMTTMDYEELEKDKKHRLTFFFGSITYLDMLMEVNSIIKTLLESGMTTKDISGINMAHSLYIFGKHREASF